MTSVRNNAVSTVAAALLLGWVIFGCLNSSAHADVADQQRSSEKSPDSLDNDDFYDEPNSPENIKAASKPPQPTIIPYFEEAKKVVYAKENERVTLNCPVKNYNESQHLIVWFRNNNTLTTGQQILADAKLYQLDKDMNLIVDKVTEHTTGDYYCTVMPHKVRMDIILKIGDAPVVNNHQMMVSASALLLLLTTVLARELSYGILSLDTILN